MIDETTEDWIRLSAEEKIASNTASFSYLSWCDKLLDLSLTSMSYAATPLWKRKKKARAEATAIDVRTFSKQFVKAKADEIASWRENGGAYDLVDMRKIKPQNYVTGRWVLTIKRDMNGNCVRCKARWVLRGFQDKQKWDQQTDSPTATRPAFRLSCQYAAHMSWSFTHVDLKTAFLQGSSATTLVMLSVSFLRKLVIHPMLPPGSKTSRRMA